MKELVFSGAVYFASFFFVFLCLVIVIVTIETATGTIIGQWPKKIHAFFKKRGWVSDTNHQV